MKKVLLALLVLVCAQIAAAQGVPVALAPPVRQQFFTAAGQPLSGGLVYSYLAGTSTPAVTYADASGTTTNSNPVVLDSGGFGTIWLGMQSYKICVADQNNVPQYCTDNINQFGVLNGVTFLSAITFNAAINANGGGSLTGTFTGNPTFSGNPIFSGEVNAGDLNGILVVNSSAQYSTLSAALSALPSTGGEVDVPPGTYAQGATPLVIGTNNVTIRCADGGASNITTTDTSSGAAFSFTGANPRVIGCTFTGPGSGAADGLVFTNNSSSSSTPPFLQNVTVNSMGGMGVRVDTSSAGNANFCSLINVVVGHSGSDGIKLVGSNTNDCTITGGHSDNNAGWGYNIQTNGNTLMGPEASLNASGTNQDFQFTGQGNFGTLFLEGTNSGNLTFGGSSQGNLIFLSSLAGSGVLSDSGNNNSVFYFYGGSLNAFSLNKLSIAGLTNVFTVLANAPQETLTGTASNDAELKLCSGQSAATTPCKTVGTGNSGNDYQIYNNAGSSAILDLSDVGWLHAKRYIPDQNSTAYSGADGAIVLSSGWGSTAAVSGAYGSDQAALFLATSSGSGQAGAPTITVTFKDGTWTKTPICQAWQTGGTGSIEPLTVFSRTAMAYEWTWQGTPSNGSTYEISWECWGGHP